MRKQRQHKDFQGMGRRLGHSKKERMQAVQERVKLQDRVAYLLKQDSRTRKQIKQTSELLQIEREKKLHKYRFNKKQEHHQFLANEKQRRRLQNQQRRRNHRQIISKNLQSYREFVNGRYQQEKDFSKRLSQLRYQNYSQEKERRAKTNNSVRLQHLSSLDNVDSFWRDKNKEAVTQYFNTIDLTKQEIQRHKKEAYQLQEREKQLIQKLGYSKAQHQNIQEEIKKVKHMGDQEFIALMEREQQERSVRNHPFQNVKSKVYDTAATMVANNVVEENQGTKRHQKRKYRHPLS